MAGDPAVLDLLEEILRASPHDDPQTVLLPRDLARLEALAGERARHVESLLDEGRRLVEEVERLVCALYEVPRDLTEAVVEHAVARAAAAAQG